MQDRTNGARDILQKQRLETLTDVVYGIVIWRIFFLIPRPENTEWQWNSVGSYVADNLATFVLVLIALLVTIIYWVQHNALFGNLERTDGRHAGVRELYRGLGRLCGRGRLVVRDQAAPTPPL